MKLKSYLQQGKTYIVAEMSANHANDLETAMRIVDAAKQAGADCLKTQVYSADTLTIRCDSDLFRIKGGLWSGQTLYDLYEHAGMPLEWHEVIFQKCREVGIDYLGTAFDRTSVDLLVRLGVEAIKIASFEAIDIPLIEYAASFGKTMIISCGMCSKDEIRDAIDACRRAGNKDIILMKCSSHYPAKPEGLNLNTIPVMASEFGVPVGFSDHSLGTIGAVVAYSLGACVIEKHFCLDRSIQTEDASFSMDPDAFAKLVQDIRFAEMAEGGVQFGCSEEERSSVIFRRSLFAVEEIAAGDVFTPHNIRSIRPGYGISPKYYSQLIGKKAARHFQKGEPLTMADLWESK